MIAVLFTIVSATISVTAGVTYLWVTFEQTRTYGYRAWKRYGLGTGVDRDTVPRPPPRHLKGTVRTTVRREIHREHLPHRG